VKDPCTRVQCLWIHEVCHWPEEDPWRYYYHFYKLNEPVGIAIEWLEKKKEATSPRATSSAAVEDGRPMCEKARERLLTMQWQRKLAISK